MSDSRSPGTGPDKTLADIREALIARLRTRSGHERYSDHSELAQGGQGQILQVWDEDLRRALAMKVVHRSGDARSEDSNALERFLEEAQITGQLDHPGIVPVHELGIDPAGRLYFTMRLVKGQDLKQVFDLVHSGQEGWSVTRALGVMLKVCEAMAYAHRKGVIHRDLKPRNVMVGRFGEVYVMDWGLARVLGHPDGHDLRPRPEETMLVASDRHDQASDELVTMDGSVIGTPAYMCPEQAQGFVADLDARADVYSCGAMLYHLLTGQPPFVPRGTTVSPRQVLWRVIEGPPVKVHQLAPHIPAELVAICEKAMARAPERRYRDMAELAQDLSAYLENRVVAAYQTGAIAELSKWVSRNRALAAALGAALLASLGGMAVAWVLKAESDRHAVHAEEQGRLARQRQDDVFRLSALQRIQDLEQEAHGLWPATPARLADFTSWLARASELLAGLQPNPADGYLGHRAKLAELEASAAAEPESGLAEDDRVWWRSQLAKLVTELEALADPDTGLVAGVSPEFGWGIARREAFAETIEERSVSGETARRLWSEAAASIADREACPLYEGLAIRPQLGLLPIGRNPHTGLWEFAHLLSGEPAVRRGDGELELDEETGIVLVLIPGGTFLMGAQAREASGPNFDRQATPGEGPVHEVTLSPFFLSKYEFTQSQWLRFTGRNPSQDNPRTYEETWSADGLPWDLVHPVEMVSWYDCVRVCERMELALPSEAQWEYAARAGTTTPWWTGADVRSLEGAVNVSDRYARDHGGTTSTTYDPWLDDGQVSHARVGSFAPNPFGLFDILGNIWEWCADGLHPYAPGPAVDPLGDAATANNRIGRGGGFDNDTSMARCSFRADGAPELANFWLGLRPARRLDP